MRFMMLIIDTQAGLSLPEPDLKALFSQVKAWYDDLAESGKLADPGAELQGADTARTIRASGVTDGPFVEAKEVLGGYSVLKADTIEEAVDIARTWPGVDRGLVTIELRPLAGQ
jgi:hypothetical protein